MLKGLVDAATGDVVIGNVALLVPALTVMETGTVAAVLALARFTSAPPAGALPVSVTVPEAGVNPITLAGVTTTLERVAALTVNESFAVTPL